MSSRGKGFMSGVGEKGLVVLLRVLLLCLLVCGWIQPDAARADEGGGRLLIAAAQPKAAGGKKPQSGSGHKGQSAKKGPGPVEKWPSQKKELPKSNIPSPYAQLLTSAGRDFTRPQPDLKLFIPGAFYAGDPFLVRVEGRGLVKVKMTFQGKSLELVPGRNGQPSGAVEALFPVGLNEKAKTVPFEMVLTWPDRTEKMVAGQIAVLHLDRGEQRLTVNQKYVTPDPSLNARIERERRKIAAVISKISPVKYWGLPMPRPVPGIVTSLFGMRRFFNGQERNPHMGLDLDGKTGDFVRACDPGRVALAANHYYAGNIVIVDHGLGVFSVYLHMSKLSVREGEIVQRGDIVGKVGATGRVTGPHLHLSFNVLGKSVDPEYFLERYKENAQKKAR